MEVENKLIPTLREGVDIIKMIFFKKLKERLVARHPGSEVSYPGKLAGAIVNDLFGTPNMEVPFALFVEENRSIIEEEMQNIAVRFPDMRIPLTDALRIQFLCDHQEGVDSTAVLTRAKDLGILMVEREIPMPASFMNMVRRLGSALKILSPQAR